MSVPRTVETRKRPKPLYRYLGLSRENNAKLDTLVEVTGCNTGIIVNLALFKFFTEIENCAFGLPEVFNNINHKIVEDFSTEDEESLFSDTESDEHYQAA